MLSRSFRASYRQTPNYYLETEKVKYAFMLRLGKFADLNKLEPPLRLAPRRFLHACMPRRFPVQPPRVVPIQAIIGAGEAVREVTYQIEKDIDDDVVEVNGGAWPPIPENFRRRRRLTLDRRDQHRFCLASASSSSSVEISSGQDVPPASLGRGGNPATTRSTAWPTRRCPPAATSA